MAEHFWRSILAAKTFNSSAGRILQREAKTKLGALDKALPLDLLDRVYRFYLDEAPCDLWPQTKKTRDEHAATLAKALGSSDAVQASFLVAAHARDGAAGLRTAGDFLSLIAKNSHPGLAKLVRDATEKFAERVLELD